MTTTPLPPRPLEALRYLREVIPFRLNLEAKHQALCGNLKVIADCSERAAEDVVWCYAKWLEARADLESEVKRLREVLQLFDVYVTAMENDDHVAGMLAYGQFEDAARAALKETP